VVEFYGRHERISGKQDGSLVGRTPGFVVSTVNCLSTIHVLSWLFLSQAIFPFHSFCFHNFSPPLRKILAAPLIVTSYGHLSAQTYHKFMRTHAWNQDFLSSLSFCWKWRRGALQLL